jgi:hypothetical protein
MRAKLLEVLVAGSDDDGTPAPIACAVETAAHSLYPVATSKDDYLAKVRALIFNLKKNADLRAKVLLETISPNQLVNMSAAEMMTSESKADLEAKSQEMTDARRLDWREKNQDEINKQCGIKSNVRWRVFF